MKKLTFLQENLLKKTINKIILLLYFVIFFNSNCIATEKWVIDKNLSSIKFELPILFASNVKGDFKKIDGFVEIDLENKKNNKALLSVEIESVESNYAKYRDLLLGPIFFDSNNYPIAVIDTKKFTYENETDLVLSVELTIKGISKIVKTKLNVKKLTSDIVQIIGLLEFSRNDFQIGTGNWSNTTILKDKIKIESNIFLIKE